MTNNLSATLNSLSDFLKRDIINENIPDRNTLAGIDGRFVKTRKSWRSELSGDLLQRFNQINGDVLKKAGYLE